MAIPEIDEDVTTFEGHWFYEGGDVLTIHRSKEEEDDDDAASHKYIPKLRICSWSIEVAKQLTSLSQHPQASFAPRNY